MILATEVGMRLPTAQYVKREGLGLWPRGRVRLYRARAFCLREARRAFEAGDRAWQIACADAGHILGCIAAGYLYCPGCPDWYQRRMGRDG